MKTVTIIHAVLFTIMLFCAVPAQAVLWNWQLDKKGKHEASLELDPYYSCMYYTFAFTKEPIPQETVKHEALYYWHMLKNFYLPRYVLIETSAYPLPISGVYLKKYATEFYNEAEITHGLNIIKAVTENFPEPYAVSLFLGNVANFVTGEDKKVVGKGYSGLLFSFGERHIVDNIMVHDWWFETELKLKGSDLRERHKLSWSYGLGMKFHFNPEIRDIIYLSIKRNRIDYKKGKLNAFLGFFVYDSTQEFKINFDLREFYKGEITILSFLFGKNFPIGKGTVTLSLGLGFIYNFKSGYTGSLKAEIDRPWSILVRPNLTLKF